LPLPPEMRERQPFLLDARRGRIIAPWPRKKELPGDADRLTAVLGRLADVQLPDWLCWCWPDRDPEPACGAGKSWLASWERDRTVYRVAA
jgi:hypothetical protein